MLTTSPISQQSSSSDGSDSNLLEEMWGHSPNENNHSNTNNNKSTKADDTEIVYRSGKHYKSNYNLYLSPSQKIQKNMDAIIN